MYNITFVQFSQAELEVASHVNISSLKNCLKKKFHLNLTTEQRTLLNPVIKMIYDQVILQTDQ